MYAIIDVHGKQYKVTEGQKVKLESIEKTIGDEVEFSSVAVSEDEGGLNVKPELKVIGKVTEHGRGDKIVVFKKKRKKGYKRTIGHRQNYTEVEIISIGKPVAVSK